MVGSELACSLQGADEPYEDRDYAIHPLPGMRCRVRSKHPIKPPKNKRQPNQNKRNARCLAAEEKNNEYARKRKKKILEAT